MLCRGIIPRIFPSTISPVPNSFSSISVNNPERLASNGVYYPRLSSLLLKQARGSLQEVVNIDKLEKKAQIHETSDFESNSKSEDSLR
jgi:hypothetical protein